MGYNQFFVCYYSNSPIIYGAIFGSLDTILYFNSVTPKKASLTLMVSMWYILKKSNNWNGSPITSVGYFFAQKACLLPHRPIKVALRSKIRKAILIYD